MNETIARKKFIFISTNQYQLCKIFISLDIHFYINIFISRKREAQKILFSSLGITTEFSIQDQEVSENIIWIREICYGSYHETSANSRKSCVESHSISDMFSIYYGMTGNQQEYLFDRVKEYIHNNTSPAYRVSESSV